MTHQLQFVSDTVTRDPRGNPIRGSYHVRCSRCRQHWYYRTDYSMPFAGSVIPQSPCPGSTIITTNPIS